MILDGASLMKAVGLSYPGPLSWRIGVVRYHESECLVSDENESRAELWFGDKDGCDPLGEE